jgi:hypothetical protein
MGKGLARVFVSPESKSFSSWGHHSKENTLSFTLT